MLLFKHMPPRYVDAFLSGSSVRVGTLYEYRDEEKFEKGIGDRLEGRFERRLRGEFSNLDEHSEIAKKLSAAGIIKFNGFSPRGKLIFAGEGNAHFLTHPDCFIFCASQSASAKIVPDPNATPRMVVQINDAKEFATAIVRAMGELGLATGRALFSPVEYKPMSVDFFRDEPDVPSPFKKDSAFAFQNEFRFCIEPTKLPISPQILTNVKWPTGLLQLREVSGHDAEPGIQFTPPSID